MKNVEVYLNHVRPKVARELLQFAKHANFKSGLHGGTSYFLPYTNAQNDDLGDNYGILYSNVFMSGKGDVDPNTFKKTMEEVWRVFQEGGKVAPVIGYARSKDGKGIYNPYFNGKDNPYRDLVFVLKAPGQNLYDLRGYTSFTEKLKERLNGPKVHYEDAAQTFAHVVLDSKIRPDYSPRNLLYHNSAGFNLVDFNNLSNANARHMGNYVRHHAEDFLRAFLMVSNKQLAPEKKKKQSLKPSRKKYYKLAKEEQKILVSNLYDNGIRERDLDYAISQIVELDTPSLDALFK